MVAPATAMPTTEPLPPVNGDSPVSVGKKAAAEPPTEAVASLKVTRSSSDAVLATLIAENQAFVRGEQKNFSDVPTERVRLATEGQKPRTAVIACADSRVAPEIMFRASIGELFVIRAAGNTTWGNEVLGSLEYAVDHLGVDVVMVLGHTKCGAVGAAISGGDPLPGALGRHIVAIAKGIESNGGVCRDVALAVERNVQCAVKFLRKDPDGCIPAAEKERGVKVVGAVYDIATGEVKVL